MDPISRRKVWDIIESEKKDKVIVLTTHSMEEADTLSDKIGTYLENSISKNKSDYGSRKTSMRWL